MSDNRNVAYGECCFNIQRCSMCSELLRNSKPSFELIEPICNNGCRVKNVKLTIVSKNEIVYERLAGKYKIQIEAKNKKIVDLEKEIERLEQRNKL